MSKNTALKPLAGQEKKVGKVIFVGPANAGKSTLTNKLVGSKVAIVSRRPHTTRQRVIGIRQGDDHQLAFVDTPGLTTGMGKGHMKHFLSSELKASLIDVDWVGLVLAADLCISRSDYLETALKQFKSIFDEVGLKAPQAVILNKCDLFDRGLVLPVIEQCHTLCQSMFGDNTIAFMPISAEKEFGVSGIVDEILSNVSPGPLLFPEDIVTTLDDQTFAAEVVREKAFAILRQELPYGIGVVCRSWERKGNFEQLFIDIVIEKDSQRPIVLGAQGRVLGKIGKLAREELERLYGERFILKLFVRTEKNWTHSAHGLERLGYRMGGDATTLADGGRLSDVVVQAEDEEVSNEAESAQS